MATIVTVHGTNATGPEVGEKWWQRTSPFERQLLALVKSPTGEVTAVPHIWDGANSETSRRMAGLALYERLKALDARKEDFVVVGHSHGGSVTEIALMEAASERNPLGHMQRWITIGTPFIALERQRALFSRMRLPGQAIYSALATLLLATIVTLLVNLGVASKSPNAADISILVLLMLPLPIIYVIAFLRNLRGYRRYSSRTTAFAAQHFAPRLSVLTHKDDEAVEGLGNLHQFQPEIFNKRFAVPIISFLSIFMVPLLLVIAASNETVMRMIVDTFDAGDRNAHLALLKQAGYTFGDGGRVTNVGGSIAYNIAIMFIRLWNLMTGPIFLVATQGQTALGTDFMAKLIGTLLLAGLVPIALVALLALVNLAVASWLSSSLSGMLSRRLNAITWNQIRQTAFGNDTVGEHARNAHALPRWMQGAAFKPLPDALGAELSRHCDEVAAKAIAKFRAGIRELVRASAGSEPNQFLSRYLTWQELIHTTYFEMPRFAKLTALIIGSAKGFEPADALMRDAEIDAIRQWRDEIEIVRPAA